MTTIKIKPLSVNACWQGKRFKTQAYKNYELEALAKIPRIKIPEPPYELRMIIGVSSSLFDIDNALKPWIDILQKRLGFNDRYIYELHVKKEIVKKGEEFIKFSINHLEIKTEIL